MGDHRRRVLPWAPAIAACFNAVGSAGGSARGTRSSRRAKTRRRPQRRSAVRAMTAGRAKRPPHRCRRVFFRPARPLVWPRRASRASGAGARPRPSSRTPPSNADYLIAGHWAVSFGVGDHRALDHVQRATTMQWPRERASPAADEPRSRPPDPPRQARRGRRECTRASRPSGGELTASRAHRACMGDADDGASRKASIAVDRPRARCRVAPGAEARRGQDDRSPRAAPGFPSRCASGRRGVPVSELADQPAAAADRPGATADRHRNGGDRPTSGAAAAARSAARAASAGLCDGPPPTGHLLPADENDARAGLSPRRVGDCQRWNCPAGPSSLVLGTCRR